MGVLRVRHDDPHRRFQIGEQLIAIGDDYWIEDESGAKASNVNGKALRIRFNGHMAMAPARGAVPSQPEQAQWKPSTFGPAHSRRSA
jgi:hypothetical protein